MTAFGVVILQACSCLGFGAITLRALDIQKELPIQEQWTWSFAIGFGLLGWLLFFFGVAAWFSTIPLLIVLGLGACGIFLLFPRATPVHSASVPEKYTIWDWLLLAAILFAALFDLLEGLSPPADGDTLAYHFTHPKNFLAAGKLEFMPRAGDGALPLLVHMTYVPVLGLGGEHALTLWVMLSGWAAMALFYTLARRFLNSRWSLAMTLIFMTTPAVLYGAGSGQVEIRNALFVMITAFAIAQALKTNQLRYAVLAGIAAGFFMGAKYLGLLFVAAGGFVILAQRRWFVHGFVFSVAAVVAGGQWYAWNYIHTGDPVFPLLYGILDYLNPDLWNATYQQLFKEMLAMERGVPVNIYWFFAYPFAATFGLYDTFESGRTGMGPFVLLTLPFTFFGLWRFRTHIARNPLLPLAAIAALYYLLWFFTGSSQRVRHLLPIYPLILLCLSAAAHCWASEVGQLKLLAGTVLLTCLVQLAGQAVFGVSYARHFLTDETREAFHHRTVSDYTPVLWVNRNLSKTDIIYTEMRQLIFLFDVPVYYGHPLVDTYIDTHSTVDNPAKLFQQFKAQNISHLLVKGALPKPGHHDSAKSKGYHLWRVLYLNGCLELTKTLKGHSFGSRTLRTFTTSVKYHILKLESPACLKNNNRK